MHDDERLLIPVSALEHYAYCPRQCALIHIDRYFDDNVWTERGTRLHERVDEAGAETDGVLRVERALPIWSDRLGLIGRADVVEFRKDGTLYPVEFKSGSRRQHLHDDVQVCAQALCLEEMLGVTVPKGAVFYHGSRRRREVPMTVELRTTTEHLIDAVRLLLESQQLPAPVADARCRKCSLLEGCMPFAQQDIDPDQWDVAVIETGESHDRGS